MPSECPLVARSGHVSGCVKVRQEKKYRERSGYQRRKIEKEAREYEKERHEKLNR